MKPSKQNVLKFCRYYKGETENPFSDPRSLLWTLERNWVREVETASPFLKEYLEGLLISLPEMANDEVVHQSLKAFLLDRYIHFGGTSEGFKEWLTRRYPK